MAKRHHARAHHGKTAKGARAGGGKDWLGLKQQIVSGIPNNTVYLAGGGLILVGGVVGLAFLGILPGFGVASTATVNVYPVNVKTGELVTFEGDFRGSTGSVVTLPNAYIAIFEDSGNKVYDNSLGMFVSHFKIQVSTANYRDGSYTVVVSDKPISAPAGVTPNPVTGVSALNTTTPPQTIAAPGVGLPSVTLT